MDRLSIITLAAAKAYANKKVEALEQVVRYIGVTTTEITDGSTTNPITINGQSVTAVAGDTVFYNGTSYAWDGSAWQEVMNIAEIITAVEALGGKVHDILGDIAPEFNSASTYAVDDIVLYEDDLYIFTNAHTGAWDSSDVTVTSIAQLVDDLRTEFETALSGKQDSLPVTANNDDVTFSGNVLDGNGNDLQSVAALEQSASGNPIIVNAQGIDAKALSVALEPIQDLHGQSAPYVGGAGKNKLPMTVSAIKAANTGGTWSGNAYTYRGIVYTLLTDAADNITGINVDGNNTGTTSSDLWIPVNQTIDGILNGCPSGGSSSTYLQTVWSDQGGHVASDAGSGVSVADIAITSVSIRVRAGVSISDKVFYPMIRLSTESDATFAPYSNICPISGWSQVKIADEGKNLADVSNAIIGTAWNGTPNTARARLVIPCKASTTYTISINGTNNLDLVYVNDNATVPASSAGESFTTSTTFTTKADSAYIIVGFNKTNISQADINALKLQLEEGSTATSYQPYAHSSATIQLGQTVYGGTLNVTSGELTVTHANIASYNGETIGEPWISSMDEYTEGGTPTTGAQVVYPLATPTTIQLTPTQLEMLEGYNYITADGEMQLVYIPESILDEAKAYTDSVASGKTDNSVVGTVENGTTASKAYAVGEHFIRNDKFCTAIAAIASGATLTLNTNYVEGTIADNLTSVKTDVDYIGVNGSTMSAETANCMPPRFKDISNDFFYGSLRSEIAAGNFKNVRPGDYITYSSSGKNFKFVVCDCDYWYNKGDTNCTTHHLRVMLTECTGITELWAGLPYDGGTGHWSGVLRCPWNAATDVDPTSASAVGSNSTNITRNGASAYAGSFVRDRLVTRILPEVFNLAFGSSNVLKVRNLLSNAVDTTKPSGGNSAWNGIASGGGWFDSYLELPSEIELYGSTVFSSSGFDTGCQDKQLAIFKNASLDTVLGRNDVWTKAVVSSSRAALRGGYGCADRGNASYASWAFPLGNIK